MLSVTVLMCGCLCMHFEPLRVQFRIRDFYKLPFLYLPHSLCLHKVYICNPFIRNLTGYLRSKSRMYTSVCVCKCYLSAISKCKNDLFARCNNA